jgi:hypothetical protein
MPSGSSLHFGGGNNSRFSEISILENFLYILEFYSADSSLVFVESSLVYSPYMREEEG